MAKNILIAEDEWELRNLLKLVLSKNDYDIIEAEDGKQAISLIKKYKPDLVLLDNNMSGYTGWGIIQQIMDNGEVEKFHSILILDKDFDPEMLELLKNRVEGFLRKPFDEKNIIDEVKRVLGEKKEDTTSTVSIPPSGKGSQSEKTVILTAEELQAMAQYSKVEEKPAEEKKEPPVEQTVQFVGRHPRLEMAVTLTPEELSAITQTPPASLEAAGIRIEKTPEPMQKPAPEAEETMQMAPGAIPKELAGQVNAPQQKEKSVEDTQEVLLGVKIPENLGQAAAEAQAAAPATQEAPPSVEQPKEESTPVQAAPPETLSEAVTQEPQSHAEVQATPQEPEDVVQKTLILEPQELQKLIEPQEEQKTQETETVTQVPEETKPEPEQPPAAEAPPELPAIIIEDEVKAKPVQEKTETQAEEKLPEPVPEPPAPEPEPESKDILEVSTLKSKEGDITKYYSIKGIELQELVLILNGQNLPEERKPVIEKGIIVVAFCGEVNAAELDKIMEVFSLSMHVVPVDARIFNDKLPQLKALDTGIYEVFPDAIKKVE